MTAADSGSVADTASTPLFVETSAFVAYFDDDDVHHQRASAVIEAIRSGELDYQPIYTNRFVLAELATVLLYNVSHGDAAMALEGVRASDLFTVLQATKATFMAACEQFVDDRYSDEEIAFFDHLYAVQALEYDADVFTFDGDFRTLGLTAVLNDTGRK